MPAVVEENIQLICLENFDNQRVNENDLEPESTSNVSNKICKTEYQNDESCINAGENENCNNDMKDVVNNNNLNVNQDYMNVGVAKPNRKRTPISRYGNPISHLMYVNYIDANISNIFEEAMNSHEQWQRAMDSEINS